MNMIVAVDNNWAIGNKNQLLISIPNDHKHFREETRGKVVVLGRKTLSTFPQERPLDNRVNIILSRNENYSVKGAVIAHSLEDLLLKLKDYDDRDVYVIGGEMTYKEMLPYCNTVHVTKIDREYQADTYFPNLDKLPEWSIVAESDEQTYFDVTYQFLQYERKGVSAL